MGTPAENADTQDDNDLENKSGEGQSFADKVNEAVKGMKLDDKGNYELPEGLSEEVQYAAMAEKRRRDTQAEFSKTKQEAKALKAEKAALLKRIEGNIQIDVTDEQKEELEDLKFSDPEAYRKKMNKYEQDARDKRLKEIDDELKQVSAGSLETEELERRKAVLEEFQSANTDVEINDDVIANDIPPRILKKLETGSITFEAFLIECRDYLKTGKVVKQEKNHQQPNLSKVGGGSKPDQNAVNEDIVLSYNKETY